MVRSVPGRRNGLAGKGKKKSKKKKKLYDRDFSNRPEQVAKRVETNRANRESPNKKSQDKSHTEGGRITNEDKSKNRARQGKGGGSTLRRMG